MFGSHEQYTCYYASTTEHLATSPIKSYMLPLFNESQKALKWFGMGSKFSTSLSMLITPI